MTCLLADALGGSANSYPLLTRRLAVGRFPWGYPSRGVVMCSACGDWPVAWRSRLCAECAAVRAEAAIARARAHARAKVKRCRGCGGVKPPGEAAYCSRCVPAYQRPTSERTSTGERKCERCPSPTRSPQAKLCVECKRRALDDQAAYKREWSRRHPPPVSSSPASPESARMSNRLARERAGQTLEPAAPIMRSNGARADSDAFPSLPAGPLAAAVCGLIRRTALDNEYVEAIGRNITGDDGKVRAPEEFHREGAPSPREAVCERLGIPSRALYDWEKGVRSSVGFDIADRVLTRAGWLWFDVWPDGEGHDLARRAFEGES